jgi:uncharacterized protein
MLRQNECVRVLALSDRISELVYSERVSAVFGDVDLVLSCGDLPFPYLEYVVTLLPVPLLYVPGNHDRPTYTSDGRTVAVPEGAVCIDGRLRKVRLRRGPTITVAGFGGSMAYGGQRHQYTEAAMRWRVARLEPRLLYNRLRYGRGADLLVTHAPAHGIHAGRDRCHMGFHAFGSFYRCYRPLVHVHGHVHPSYGVDLEPTRVDRTDVRSVFGHEVLEIHG